MLHIQKNKMSFFKIILAGVFSTGFASAPNLIAQEDNERRISIGDLLDAGQSIWEEYAPPELQEEYRLPTMEEVEQFLAHLEHGLAEGDLQHLADYAPQAEIALGVLRHFEGGDSLADWLAPRVDYLKAARESTQAPPPPPAKPDAPQKPAVKPQLTQDYWTKAMEKRPKPKKADRYMPIFKKAFLSIGVPGELAWLAEVESSMNLEARSPVGAYGPFQFMPATAERFGLRVGSPDDRTHPQKSAEAAANYLKILYRQFQSWPLALAAYNAGEGRVGRLLEARKATSFEEVAAHLPAETRMYVPKVLGTIAIREQIDPTSLPAPEGYAFLLPLEPSESKSIAKAQFVSSY